MGPLIWETRKKGNRERGSEEIENDNEGDGERVEDSAIQGDERIRIENER